jgi:SAM-dependent methyltransferase
LPRGNIAAARDESPIFPPEQAGRPAEADLESWFAHLEADFRGTTLNRLVASMTPPGLVLNVGCGRGALTAQLIRSGREVVSLDPAEHMVAMCRGLLQRQQLDSTRVRLAGVEDIEDHATFDAVIALDVIEHIEDDLGALKRIRRALKPTGTLVLSVPSLSRLYGPKDAEVGHYRRYDKGVLIARLERSDFELHTCRYWNAIGVVPVWLSKRREKSVDDSFRYSRSPAARAINRALRLWFQEVENRVRPPLGLTLLVTARPR